MVTGPMARPSRPSVRLTALAEPTMTKTANGIKSKPRSGCTSLKKGRVKVVSKPGSRYIQTATTGGDEDLTEEFAPSGESPIMFFIDF